MELALGLAAVGALPAIAARGKALLGRCFAMRFGPVGRTGASAYRPLLVAPLAVAVLRAGAMAGMPFRPLAVAMLAIVAIAALLAVLATVRLGEGTLAALRLRLGRGLETLECLGRSHEIGGERRNSDLLPSGSLDIAQVAARALSPG